MSAETSKQSCGSSHLYVRVLSRSMASAMLIIFQPDYPFGGQPLSDIQGTGNHPASTDPMTTRTLRTPVCRTARLLFFYRCAWDRRHGLAPYSSRSPRSAGLPVAYRHDLASLAPAIPATHPVATSFPIGTFWISWVAHRGLLTPRRASRCAAR